VLFRSHAKQGAQSLTTHPALCCCLPGAVAARLRARKRSFKSAQKFGSRRDSDWPRAAGQSLSRAAMKLTLSRP